jgi:O-acetylserine/cysteine efflux transporter
MTITPRDLFLVMCFTFIWGFNFVVVRLGLDSFPPLFFLALRFLLAAIPAVFYVSRSGVSTRLIVGIGLVLGTLHYSALYLGIAFGVSPGIASLIVQIHIILTLFLSWFVLDERPSANQIVGVVTSFAGLSVLIWSRFESTGLVALGAVLLAAAFLAISNLMMRSARVKNTLGLTVWSSLIPPIPLLLISLLTEQGLLEGLMSLSWRGTGALLYGSFLGTLLATAIATYLLGKYSANVIAPFYLLVPIFAIASSALILGERPTVAEYFSSTVMLVGLLIVIRANSPVRSSSAAIGPPTEREA